MEILARLTALVGPDPGVDELRCVYGRPGLIPPKDLELAAQRALRADPERVRARVTLFLLEMDRGDLATAVKHLNALRRGLPEDRYAALLSEHPDLLRSLEYQHWQRFIADR